MTEHILKQFDTELEDVRSKVLRLGGVVERQIIQAMTALRNADLTLCEQVITGDHEVNRLEVELDEDCVHIIARRQPAARDLRMIMTVVKTITDLERIGDEAKKIAKKTRAMYSSDIAYVPRIELHHSADTVVSMLRQALDAFARADCSVAAEVARRDKEVNAEFKAGMRQLITFMMEDPRTISRALELLFIAKAIERIGDHAKNISEYVVYMEKGRDVRHLGLAGLERAMEKD
ncbi:MAG: phosphate signaling complex protein PhoU [Gammaproteobacteria bacterium]|nr:phosphate signaling complex protein PhoU [Rhodocyclaceae bacterium]MBU3909710.1 phosphate signaling complex protein PhoU [Gammaproteobacteria bacterium]MBU3989278.1 phosphate signaling complex protein PhoU [Gammaproteobacteria bacterium]MBU4005243.1 phosphate signaling complex protein PhoU [Gammaproteobacteria bacterium]MBU4022422.1 phosphate signaling complex protein PhoU [Gammaproteobacteria bacterium]